MVKDMEHGRGHGDMDKDMETWTTTWRHGNMETWHGEFFSFFCELEAPFFVVIQLCRPSKDSLQWSTIPDGSPSKNWQPTVCWGDHQIRTRDFRFTVWYCCHHYSPTWRNGDMETWRHGHGGMDMDTWTWRHGHGYMDMETWAWRHGHKEMNMETWTWRREHGNMNMETRN